jgi:hypothetical protein
MQCIKTLTQQVQFPVYAFPNTWLICRTNTYKIKSKSMNAIFFLWEMLVIFMVNLAGMTRAQCNVGWLT